MDAHPHQHPESILHGKEGEHRSLLTGAALVTLPPDSPLLSDPVDIDNVIRLANGDFGGVRGECHAFDHVALPPILWRKAA